MCPTLPLMLVAAAIAASTFATPGPQGTFTPFVNEANARGAIATTLGSPQTVGQYGFGVGLADLDRDGDADLVALGNVASLVSIFENTGSGQFIDRTASCGITGLLSPGGFGAADLDADGDLDLVISQRGHGTRLFLQVAPLVFADATAGSGLDSPWVGRCVAMGDLDGDGWVDVLVGNYAGLIAGTDDAHATAYLNQAGSGTFIESSAWCGLDQPSHNFMVSPADLDRDGDPDLYVSNDRAHVGPILSSNRLLRNDRGRWTDLTPACGDAGSAFFSMGVARADMDGNGLVDLLCTNVTAANQPLGAVHPLFMQVSPMLWDEQSTARGVVTASNLTGWSVQAFDADNDGDPDLHIVHQAAQDRFFLNTDGQFTDLTTAAALGGGPQVDYGSAVADVDGDGALDVVTNPLGAPLRLFMNKEGRRRPAVRIRVEGQWPNIDAIGALVDVEAGGRTTPLEVCAGGVGYLGMNDLRVHAGLGDAPRADRVTVTWPWTGTTRTITALPAGACWTVHPPERLGDGNDDWRVDAEDRAMLSGCVGESPITCPCLVFDFNGDGEITSGDTEAFDHRAALARCDFDLDGDVDGADLATLVAGWSTGDPRLDATGDGAVTGADLAALLAEWST